MKEILKKNTFFLIPYLIFLISGLIVILIFKKPQIHIFMNHYYNSFFDIFFYYITYLGDGAFAVIIIFLMLFFRLRNHLFMASGLVFSLSIVTVFKQYFFNHLVRPHSFFDWYYPYKLRLVAGVDYNGFNSFPSGHTMSAFCVFLSLALIVKNKWLKLFCFVIALLTGYSRVYLSQHFFMDIVAGSFIGVTATLMSYYFFEKIKRSWIDKSLIDLIGSKNK